jgi:hypothetical protein
MIDGKPIVGVAAGLRHPSPNTKTGPMVQTYMLRSDLHPLEAVNTGDDVSICGNCRHRGKIVPTDDGATRNVERSCYVTLIHGPSIIWKGLRDGKYTDMTPERASKLLAHRLVRIGAYGDPAAIPLEVWDKLLSKSAGSTGYTHLWRDNPEFAKYCMASCDTEIERAEAKLLGFRTFRVRGRDEPVLKGEGQCPASNEMNNVTQCAACMLCDGKKRNLRGDVTIQVHGRGKTHFEHEKEKADEHRTAA